MRTIFVQTRSVKSATRDIKLEVIAIAIHISPFVTYQSCGYHVCLSDKTRDRYEGMTVRILG
jgi:hypothetical protein